MRTPSPAARFILKSFVDLQPVDFNDYIDDRCQYVKGLPSGKDTRGEGRERADETTGSHIEFRAIGIGFDMVSPAFTKAPHSGKCVLHELHEAELAIL